MLGLYNFTEPVNATLTSVKGNYLITENAELTLEFYDEHNILTNELEKLENSLLLLSELEQDLVIFTPIESIKTTTNEPIILNFIGKLLMIPHADAAKPTINDQSKIDIVNTKVQISLLKEKINAIKTNGELNEQDIKEAKLQLESILTNLKENSKSLSQNNDDVIQKIQHSANNIEKITDIKSEHTIQENTWTGNKEQITTEVYDVNGNVVNLKANYEKIRDGKFKINLDFNANNKPGLYKVKTILSVNGETYTSEKEFAWGLVSLNTKKSIYKPGETADFEIVVLDSEGHPIDNANLTMDITSPTNQVTTLSSNNGIVSGSETGLYEANYTTSNEGTYSVFIHANANGIDTDFNTTFDVKTFYEFDIIRTAQSKVDPTIGPNSFDVKIDVESFIDQNTITVVETIPSVLDVVTDGKVKTVGDRKIITWDRELVNGKTQIQYSYSVPYDFPALYDLGPLTIKYDNSSFNEARPWFVANDPAINTGNTATATCNATCNATSCAVTPTGTLPGGVSQLIIFSVATVGTISGTPTYGGASMTAVATPVTGPTGNTFGLYYFKSSSATGSSASVTLTAKSRVAIEVVVLTGVDNTGNPITGTAATGSGTTTTRTLTPGGSPESTALIFGGVQTDANQSITASAGTLSNSLQAGANSVTLGTAYGPLSSITLDWGTSAGNSGIAAAFKQRVWTLSLTDNMGITDAITTNTERTLSLTDNMGITDTLTTNTERTLSLSDNMGITDTLTANAQRTLSLSDNMGITDTLTTNTERTLSLSDNMGITDAITTNTERTLSLSDNMGITDTLTANAAKSGSISAKLAAIQPYEQSNKITKLDKYLYEIPIASDETFLMVVVTEQKGSLSNTIQSAVRLTSCEGATSISKVPEEKFEVISSSAPKIFDVKFQIANNPQHRSDIESEFSYVNQQDLKISAIVDAQTPLQRSELRVITMGQPENEYVAIKMNTISLPISNSTYVISATIPSHLMQEPAISYWIHIIDEDHNEAQSKQYNIGVKPASIGNISFEMDISNVKQGGALVRPQLFVDNNDLPSYGIVSLIVNGQVVSKKSQLFTTGETIVNLEWKSPNVSKLTTYDVMASVDLYGKSISTQYAKLHIYPKTITMLASEIQSIELVTENDRILADPALIYASNSIDENLRLHVIAPNGQCIIGVSEDCTIHDSTKNQRGGLTSIEYENQIIRVRYSGPDSSLERFSITSIDPLVGNWTISLETSDGIIPQVQAMKDMSIKVKYRTHSETITVYSE
jgi:ribosomal protein L7/L12